MQNQYLIIVAGGNGSRMQNSLPKQFIELNGEPIIIKTINCFLKYNPAIKIIISVHIDFKIYLQKLLQTHFIRNIHLVIGGETRFNSVKNGLALINDPNAIVGIHDAARPFVSQQTIKNCFETASTKGNAIPCISLNESIRKVTTEKNNAVNRNNYKIIQTPQCFLVSKIKQAFIQPYSPLFTDDAAVLESIGETIFLVDGNIENIKITTPYDLKISAIF
ncbi:MAG: 2-C-methyl-D-erythritol 4-phosphate cytidylyltransferase [Mycobacteriaceae bacterium]|nr:2-C-methyl-D-erythritol 4-phosphate cytidylyltransferase [Mycobacteriaceae bacterium]